jgi:hypothetical protein
VLTRGLLAVVGGWLGRIAPARDAEARRIDAEGDLGLFRVVAG